MKAMTEPTPSLNYSPQMDGLRAFCIVFTLFNHIADHPAWINGSVGVDVFFALSGFLITGILKNADATGRALLSFYLRRFFRIVPVYYLGLILTAASTVALGLAFGDWSKADKLKDVWFTLVLFCGELMKDGDGVYGHSWTIGIEEKFYLVWPLVFFAFSRAPILREVFLVAVLLSVYFFCGDYLARGYGGISFGCIAGILYFWNGWYLTRVNLALAVLIASYAAILMLDASNLLVSASAALLIPGLYHQREWIVSKCLSWRPLAKLGRLTYSIYILHVLCLNVVKIILGKLGHEHWLFVFLLGYLFSVVVAWLVYNYFELPLIERGRMYAKGVESRAVSGLA